MSEETTEFVNMVFGICLVGSEAIGNAVAVAVGHRGTGPAFGGPRGIGLRQLGSQSTTPVAWGAYTIAKAATAPTVEEFNGAAPYPTLNALGMADAQVAAAKSVLTAECYPRETHEEAFFDWLASKGYEVIPP